MTSILDRLEADLACDGVDFDRAIRASIAISLKRIADALDRQTLPITLGPSYPGSWEPFPTILPATAPSFDPIPSTGPIAGPYRGTVYPTEPVTGDVPPSVTGFTAPGSALDHLLVGLGVNPLDSKVA